MNVYEVVMKLLNLVLDIVPLATAQSMLDDAAVKRANAVADLAEAEKFKK